MPQRGRLESRVLGLWLGLEAGPAGSTLLRLRFYAGTAIVPEPEELADALAEIERLKRERGETQTR